MSYDLTPYHYYDYVWQIVQRIPQQAKLSEPGNAWREFVEENLYEFDITLPPNTKEDSSYNYNSKGEIKKIKPHKLLEKQQNDFLELRKTHLGDSYNLNGY